MAKQFDPALEKISLPNSDLLVEAFCCLLVFFANSLDLLEKHFYSVVGTFCCLQTTFAISLDPDQA